MTSTLGEIDFTPLLESHRRAKRMGVAQEELERALDQLFADVRERILADDDKVTWAFIRLFPKLDEPSS